MINNYKAQRNVRAELGGAVDLGEPVSLYIKEDELKYSSKNLATNGKFQDGTVAPFTTGTGSVQMDVVELATNPVSGRTSLRLLVGDANDVAQGNFNVSVGKTYKISFNRTIPNHTTDSKCKFRLGIPGDVDAYADIISFTSNATTGVFRESLVFTAINSTLEFRINESGEDNDAEIFIDDIQLYEVVDHTYKLMAVNDTIPSQSVNTEALGSELITNTNFESSDANWTLVYSGGSGSGATLDKANTSSPLAGTKDLKLVNNAGENAGVVSNGIAFQNGRTYKVSMKYIVSGGNAFSKIGSSNSSTGGANISGSSQQTLNSTSLDTMEHTFTAGESGTFYLTVFAGNGVTFQIDDVSVKEVYGYDYYNAPAYKFGIVSSVYDQSTGAMKTSGVAGDEIDVTVQGECILRKSGTYNTVAGYDISQITASGDAIDRGDDLAKPNQVGVIAETNANESATQPIILWQGVEFSEHFVHKNSLQVMAKCDETITKFRPVSLFLDSEGDLLCRHDDIPETAPDANTDHTGADPGKWGVAELGGVSGDIIPVTVAGKTTISTHNSVPYRNSGDLVVRITEQGWVSTTTNPALYAPNALGTVMEGGGAGDDVPITIFQGTPIGTITDWKRTIKVTAKANGTIYDFCPVSLYLDANGNYRCIPDNIPNLATDTDNGTWCDFRKWGIAQNNANDGEDVEVIVQGRTRVRNTITAANKGDFVRKISIGGNVSGNTLSSIALSSLGIVEKESVEVSDRPAGVIIIF